MKKSNFLLGLAAFFAITMASCGGNKSTGESNVDPADFAASQPLASGEYRAVSFQYIDSASTRMPFDGRIIFALDPENSGIYVYENGNRTHFKATVSLEAPFSKADTIFTALDNKQRNVAVVPGTEADTLFITKGDKPVKIAFERKAISEMPASDAWARINNLLSK